MHRTVTLRLFPRSNYQDMPWPHWRPIPTSAVQQVRMRPQQHGVFSMTCSVREKKMLLYFSRMYWMKLSHFFPVSTFTLVEMNARKPSGKFAHIARKG